ncbi:hypothetical protein [Deinococcus sp. PESE-13]
MQLREVDVGISDTSSPAPVKSFAQRKNESLATIDELKRFEKAHDLAKDMFNNSENLLKNADEKSRNNTAAASAITALAFILRKLNDNLVNLDTISILTLAVILVFTYILYSNHFNTIKIRNSKLIDPNHIKNLLNTTNYPTELVKLSAESYIELYHKNLEILNEKNANLKPQEVALKVILVASFVYVILGGVKW